MKTSLSKNVAGQLEKLQTACADISKASFTWAIEGRNEGIVPQKNQAVREWIRAQLEEARSHGVYGASNRVRIDFRLSQAALTNRPSRRLRNGAGERRTGQGDAGSREQ